MWLPDGRIPIATCVFVLQHALFVWMAWRLAPAHALPWVGMASDGPPGARPARAAGARHPDRSQRRCGDCMASMHSVMTHHHPDNRHQRMRQGAEEAPTIPSPFGQSPTL